MPHKCYTYNHKLCKISVNLIEITDFLGDPTIAGSGDDWSEVIGLNGIVQRSLQDNFLYTVTLPMQRNSPQLDALAGLAELDKRTGAGPFPFAFRDLNGTDLILGQCWIKNMKDRGTLGREGSARNVVLSVVSEIEWQGA